LTSTHVHLQKGLTETALTTLFIVVTNHFCSDRECYLDRHT